MLPRQVWSIRVRLGMSGSSRDLALFNLAIDSKLRASDLVRLKTADVCSGTLVRDRGIVTQLKTGRPVQFEITEVTRQSVERLPAIQTADDTGYLFRSGTNRSSHISARQYARIVHVDHTSDSMIAGSARTRFAEQRSLSSTGRHAICERFSYCSVTQRSKPRCATSA